MAKNCLRPRSCIRRARFRQKSFLLKYFLCFLVFSTSIFADFAETSGGKLVSVDSDISKTLGLRTVRAIHIDNSGKMWVGTQSGLLRFDGTATDGTSSLLKTQSQVWRSDIADIKEDSSGNVWVLSANAGAFFFEKDERGTVFEAQQYASSLIDAHSFAVTNKRIWIADRRGLNVINLSLGLPDPDKDIELVFQSQVRLTNLSTAENGAVCAAHGLEFRCWDGKTLREHKVTEFGKTLKDSKESIFTAISSSSKGLKMLAGTNNGELYKVSLRQGVMKRICGSEIRPTAIITSIMSTGNSHLIGTDSGLYALEEKDKVACRRVDIRNTHNAHVTNAYAFGHQFWVTTYSGLFTLAYSPFSHISASNSAIDNEVMSFEHIQNVGLFIGTYAGLYLQRENTKEIQEIDLPTNSQGQVNKRVMALRFDGRRLWIGLREGGVLWFDPQTEVFIKAPKILKGLSVTTIEKTPNETVSVGTYGHGLFLFSEKNQENVAQYHFNNEDEFKNITVVETINEELIFVASEFRSYFLCREGSKWISCKLKRYSDFSTNSRVLSAVMDENEAALWLGFQNDGLHRLELNSRLSGVTTKIALGDHDSESIFGLLTSDDKFLWITTSKGLVRYSTLTHDKVTYFAQDGLQDNDFNYGAAHKTKAGTIYIGGSNGFNFFSTKNFILEREKPDLQFREIQLGEERQRIRRSFGSDDFVQLRHHDYLLRIFFHISDFIQASRVRYRYKLHPFDPAWIDGDNDGSATYTNIPPGDYVFRVQGANSAGVWNREGISMNIRVLPPPWRTWWAYCLYAITFFVCLFLAKKWYDNNVLRVKAIEMAREKTQAADAALDEMHEQLESQDVFVRRIRNHNIRNLTSVEQLINERSQFLPDDISAEIMRGAARPVRALSLLERSLKYYNDRLYVNLQAFTADCVSDLSEGTHGCGHITTINNVTGELLPVKEATSIALVIHELLANAYLHAFRGKSGNHYINIAMAYRGDSDTNDTFVELRVQDNGVGMPDAIAGELPGLSFVQKIVDQHDGTTDIASNDGTIIRITLRLPIMLGV